MSKPRIDSIKEHGHSACISITKELEELGWKLGDYVKIEPDHDKLTITLVEEA
jgi:hypothetical protein